MMTHEEWEQEQEKKLRELSRPIQSITATVVSGSGHTIQITLDPVSFQDHIRKAVQVEIARARMGL